MKTVASVLCGALIAFATIPQAAHAQDAASCASGLDSAAKIVFDDTLADATAGGDLKTIITQHTKALAAAGKLSRSEARAAATAAAECLKLS